MALDLVAVSRQLAGIGETLRQRQAAEEQRLRLALSLLGAEVDLEELKARIQRAKESRAALPVEPLTTRIPAPDTPEEFSVLASDGSTIEPDRHGAALCFLINMGLVAIHYGAKPKAMLLAEPHLGYKDEELYVQTGKYRVLRAGSLLSIHRQSLEATRLAALGESIPDARPAVALQDGTLMLGTLEGPGLEQWLHDTLLPTLLGEYDRLQERQLPFAAYASRPRHAEVVNTLRLLSEEGEQTAHDDQYAPRSRPVPPAAGEPSLAGLTDRTIFARVLAQGERSAVFQSQWTLSVNSYRQHKIHFFYLNVGDEIARIEIPEWVAQSAPLLSLVHAVVMDQCARGGGYPTVLIEAHEQAALRGADRRQFEEVLNTALVRAGLPLTTSLKEHSKRIRAL